MKRKVSISGYAVEVLFRYAENTGIDTTPLRNLLGFEENLLNIPAKQVSIKKFMALWDGLVIQSGDPHFGLHLGERFLNLLTGGSVLHAMLANCDTVEQALDRMTRYQYLGIDVFETQTYLEGNYAYRVLEPVTTDVSLNQHHFEAALCVSASTLRFLTQNKIRFIEVHFPHSSPIDISEHQRIFGCPIRFKQPRMEFVFSSETLAWPLPMANTHLAGELEKVIHTMSGDLYRPDSWADCVKHQIRHLLWQGEKPGLEVVASTLAISPRQLQYRLEEERTSFQGLLDICRKEAAIRYMNAGYRTLGEIACLLGFSGQSSFNHAFKRWTGVSPRHYARAQMDAAEKNNPDGFSLLKHGPSAIQK
ncbi:MAG: AraC family transcriptional regulator [Anaerolineae bacterium]|nr:AraC family transcriptional regulator [Anaerolineae bacterium]